MSQTFSWSTFSAGMAVFLLTAGETLKNHNEWAYLYSTPLGFFHGVALGASFIAIIIGAIGAQLPRSAEKNYGQRKDDLQQPPAQPEGTTRTTVIVTKPADTKSDQEKP